MQPKRQRSLPIERKIRQNGAHQGLVDQLLLKGRTMANPVMRLIQRRAHQTCRGHGGIEPRVMHHLENGAQPRALIAEPMGNGSVILDFGRGIGAIAKLVLQPLNPDAIARALKPAWHQKAGEPLGGLRQCQKPVRHWRRAEPFMPDKAIGIAFGCGRGGIGANVRSALFFSHRHAQGRARFARQGLGCRIIGAGRQFGHPVGKERLVSP
jgi:hypothetical protein